MLSLAFVESSRSHQLAKKLQEKHEIKKASRRGGGGARKRNKTKKDQYLADKGDYFALSCELVVPLSSSSSSRFNQSQGTGESSLTGGIGRGGTIRRIVLVDWDNHPMYDIIIGDEPNSRCVDGICEEGNVPDTTTNCTVPIKKNNNKCQHLCFKHLDEASTTLRTIFRGKVLVAYDLDRILHALRIQHQWIHKRSISAYPPFMQETADAPIPRTLDDLMENVLKRRPSPKLQHRAVACMDLFKKSKDYWEEDIKKVIQHKERQDEIKQQGNLASISEVEEPYSMTSDFGIRGLSADPSVVWMERYSAPMSLERCVTPLTSERQPSLVDPFYGSIESMPPSMDTLYWTARTNQLLATEPLVNGDSYVGRRKESDDSTTSVSTVLTSLLSKEEVTETSSMSSTPTWGGTNNLWIPRPEKESTHPVCEEDWLEDHKITDRDTPSAPVKNESELWYVDHGDEDDLSEIDHHLPSRLLNDSSSEDSEHDDEAMISSEREVSSHPVDVDSWLDSHFAGKNRRRSSQRKDEDSSTRFSFFGRKSAPARTLSSSERITRHFSGDNQNTIQLSSSERVTRRLDMLSDDEADPGERSNTVLPDLDPMADIRDDTLSPKETTISNRKFTFFRSRPQSPTGLSPETTTTTVGVAQQSKSVLSMSQFSFFGGGGAGRKSLSIPNAGNEMVEERSSSVNLKPRFYGGISVPTETETWIWPAGPKQSFVPESFMEG